MHLIVTLEPQNSPSLRLWLYRIIRCSLLACVFIDRKKARGYRSEQQHHGTITFMIGVYVVLRQSAEVGVTGVRAGLPEASR
jgi:hypothetical protein